MKKREHGGESTGGGATADWRVHGAKRIVSVWSGMNLSVYDPGFGIHERMTAYQSDDDMYWTFTPLGDEHGQGPFSVGTYTRYTIRLRDFPSLYLIWIYQHQGPAIYYNATEHHWLLVPKAGTTDTYFIFKRYNHESGEWIDTNPYCLDVRGASRQQFGEIQLYPFHGGLNQQWRLTS